MVSSNPTFVAVDYGLSLGWVNTLAFYEAGPSTAFRSCKSSKRPCCGRPWQNSVGLFDVSVSCTSGDNASWTPAHRNRARAADHFYFLWTKEGQFIYFQF